MSHQYAVKLPMFEGPLDLLLYLIKINEIDIFNIPIVALTTHYLDTIKNLSRINLSNLAEFFQMAAHLTYIKSSMLLPQEKKKDDDSIEDPRDELARRLLEYQALKEASSKLGMRPQLNYGVFTGGYAADIETALADVIEGEQTSDLSALTKAFAKAMTRFDYRQRQKKTHSIVTQTISIDEKISEINYMLGQTPTLTFRILAAACATRIELVITFLAILEMTKAHTIKLFQNDLFTTLYLTPHHYHAPFTEQATPENRAIESGKRTDHDQSAT